jgi:putative transposase
VAEGGRPTAVASETAFLVDFLPVSATPLTRTGFTIDHDQYFSDARKPRIARRDRLEKFVLRRGPRDISRIWALDPDGDAYVQVPYRTLSRPPISVGERRAAVARLREQGRDQVDEHPLFAMVEQMRQITDAAAATTRRARIIGWQWLIGEFERAGLQAAKPDTGHRPVDEAVYPNRECWKTMIGLQA